MSPQRNNAPAAALADFSVLVNRSIEDERIDLARAALAIARTEYPQLDPDSYLARLQGLAQRVRARLTRNPAPPETIAALNTVLLRYTPEAVTTLQRGDWIDGRPSPNPADQLNAWKKQTVLAEHELPGTARHDPLAFPQLPRGPNDLPALFQPR